MKTQRTNPRLKQEQWQQIISKQEASDQSVPAYCRKQGFNEKTFYKWRKKLRNGQEIKPEGFIEIKSTDHESRNLLRIETPGGYCLEVEPGTEKGYVRSILEVLAVLR